MSENCYCGSQRAFVDCCGPLISAQIAAPSPESLMRSRYTAYCLGNYDYILATYAQAPRSALSIASLEDSARGTQWLTLIVHPSPTLLPSQVEYSAYYFLPGKKLGVLHETSNFVMEDNQWRYLDGELHDDCGTVNQGRNDKCVCGSGKKFKQCCLNKA
ncbi:hypothetical protein DXV75_05110 [Alteromonas aestuariivivens]|uniref:YchJ-like middle NTF2-like domain-containing protein n=1 Tax=Alteromonas aestuariivivens TaxID=1938339 RepID=A0A3D8MBA3_9ALTE|nr:YchJ family protein [Alteromonas aestuariivivens]RDV27411.1 hypothetical protein DXV75_05110 [Alteromonas aestuariivivens]